MNIMQDVTKLLNDVFGKIKDDGNQKIAQDERGERFNVFSLCGVDHYEVWHSKILAEFLNPRGSHGQKGCFLGLFSKRFFFDEDCFSAATTVSTEVTSYIKDLRIGRFDILMEDAQKRCVCIIENKIFAGEQPEQLSRYSDWLSIERKGWKTFLVFLTLDGRKSATIEGEKSYIKLPYWKGNDDDCIASWIGECAKKVMELIEKGQNGLQHLHSTLEQYKIHIEKIAKGEMAMNEEIIDEMKRNMASSQAIFDNYKTACLKWANTILTGMVLEWLNNCSKNDESRWFAEGSCNFNKGQEGVCFFCKSTNPVGKEAEHGHIFVIFEATHLSQCEVAIWQDCKSEEKLINLKKGEDDNIVKENLGNEWTVTYDQSVNWPVWRGVKAPDDKTPRDSSYVGMDWNGEFFDKMESSQEYRGKLIEDIGKSIVSLYNFQKEYGKSHSPS